MIPVEHDPLPPASTQPVQDALDGLVPFPRDASPPRAALRVGLDVSNALAAIPSGVARYIRRLARALEELPQAPLLTHYCRPSRRRHGHPRQLFPSGRHRWLVPIWPPYGIDLFHGLDLRLPRHWQGPTVVTIHDLAALDGNDHAPPAFLAKKRAGYVVAAHRAHAIITHTLAVRAQVIERLGVEPDRVHVAPLASGIDEIEQNDEIEIGEVDGYPRFCGFARNAVRAEPGFDMANPGQARSAGSAPREDWLLVVGGPSRRKGAPRIVALLDYWRKRLGWQPPIRWVGSATTDERAAFLASLPATLRPRIELLGHVPDAQLSALYDRAMALLVLSDREGFALPIVEAAQRGCPVLGVTSAPLAEVLPPTAAWWFGEPPAASESLFAAFLDPALRQARVARAATHARRYSWAATARATLRAYDAALAVF